MSSGCLEVEVGDAEDVVDGSGEEEPGSVALAAEVSEFPAAGDGLHPPEGFFDPFADPLTDRVSPVAGRASIDRAGTIVVFWAT